jgi:SNF2 family DNA or RNA helicase
MNSLGNDRSIRCVLHPYQQVGLNWLVLMHKLGLNMILGDEMVLCDINCTDLASYILPAYF